MPVLGYIGPALVGVGPRENGGEGKVFTTMRMTMMMTQKHTQNSKAAQAYSLERPKKQNKTCQEHFCAFLQGILYSCKASQV